MTVLEFAVIKGSSDPFSFIGFNMYVCLCADLTEDQVRAAIKKGHNTVQALKDEINVATGCESCMGYVGKLLKEESISSS